MISNIVLIDVECPKCHTIRKVDIKQTSILCSNEDCLTNTGKRTRFYVYQKRIINYNNI